MRKLLSVAGLALLLVIASAVAALVWQYHYGVPDPTQWRSIARMGQTPPIPDRVKDAFVAAEEPDFLSRPPVSPVWELLRFVLRRPPSRGSSISTTLAHTLLALSENRTGQTFRWIIGSTLLTEKIERTMSRANILEAYMNLPFMGESLDTTSRTLFGKPVSDVTVAEAAYLAGLRKSPGLYTRNAERALARRNEVLDAMVRTGAISREEADTAKAQPLGLDR